MSYTKKPDGIYKDKLGKLVEHKKYSTRIYWSPQMLSDLKRYFPTTSNQECADILQVSVRTIVRKARELGLEKDNEWLLSVWEENRLLACSVAKSKGHPGSFLKGGYRKQYKSTN